MAQAGQRSTMTVVAVLMMIIGGIVVVLGFISPGVIAGTALFIGGAVILTGGVLMWGLVALGAWWQFESRQQVGLLARGLGEALDRPADLPASGSTAL